MSQLLFAESMDQKIGLSKEAVLPWVACLPAAAKSPPEGALPQVKV